MIKTIVFSKDRAAQLDLFFTSLARNDNLDRTVYVLYTSSNSKFEDAYDILREYREPEEAYFMGEYDFKNDLISLLEAGNEEFVQFFVDDDIVYRKIHHTENDLKQIFANPKVFSFATRLGINTTNQDPHNPNNKMMFPKFSRSNGFLFWNWKTVSGNFGYNLNVDGEIYRADQITKLIKSTNFTNPNTLEAHLQSHQVRVPEFRAGCSHSTTVGIPINRTQHVFKNKAGEYHGRSPVELNKGFLAGKRLSLDKMDLGGIIGSHQELKVSWG